MCEVKTSSKEKQYRSDDRKEDNEKKKANITAMELIDFKQLRGKSNKKKKRKNEKSTWFFVK